MCSHTLDMIAYKQTTFVKHPDIVFLSVFRIHVVLQYVQCGVKSFDKQHVFRTGANFTLLETFLLLQP